MTRSTPGSSRARSPQEDGNEDGYFALDFRANNGVNGSGGSLGGQTPSPKTTRFAQNVQYSGSESEWQDVESDSERPSVTFHTPSKLSSVITPDDNKPSGSPSSSKPYKLQKPKFQRKRLKDRTNDSFNLFVPSLMKKNTEPSRDNNDADDEGNPDDEDQLQANTFQNGPLTAASKEGNALLRRRLKKIRSKSDTGVNTLPTHMFKKKKFQSQSVDLRDEFETHSDTEVRDVDNPLTTTNTGGAEKPKRKFYVRSNTMNELFHSGANGDSPGGLFKRRISAFNTGEHSGTAWKDLKKTVRAGLGMRKRDRSIPEIDYEKSTELINELIAGAPAAIVLGSTFQRDEKNLKRIPILMEQIKFTITDTTTSLNEKNRKYRLDLEYGSGPARLTWTVFKEYKDFWLLHTRLKSISFQGIGFSVGRSKLPKFPTRHRAASRGRSGAHQQTFHGPRATSSHPELQVPRRNASGASSANEERPTSLFTVSSRDSSPSSSRQSLSFFRQDVTPSQSRPDDREKNAHTFEELCGDMQKYIQQLLQRFRFRPDANKIFQFLELSNMSIRLAPENSFHGKEGYLFVRSSSSLQGWRVSHWRPSDMTQMIQRHTNKWFLVRHSYIVCVQNIYETNILEVFLVDSGFKVTERTGGESEDEDDKITAPNMHITLQLENKERKIKLITGSDKSLRQWVDSINEMKDKTVWSKPKRFESFAPVRRNAHAQWFVDGRDYFWAVSGAIDMAKDVIYIHDWWLSPEIYMRRPAEGNQEWRLDRLLKRKAEEGVKIFVIVYRNVGQTIPIDSQYTKHSLMDLHPNIYVMRSPNQLLQNTFFWAHHEKLCLVDHTVAFVGGIDLCFGRWDTPDHALSDDAPYAFNSQQPKKTRGEEKFDGETQIWPGKDYSNPRVQDFYALDHPYDDMYDRDKVPRMPWHDVHMMVFGQPARDLTRHFVQRWNYLLRQKRPSRFTPMLLPPPDLTEEQVRQLDLDGTCEVQILRSSGNWSLGLQEPEHSIQNAYLKAIEQSEHFVYIENQFFITSTSVEATKIENRIGDALVERIVRAHENGELWRAVIIIPLMPGFESQVDQPDGSSVRVIMQCQYYSISRGANSIFGRLEAAGINPDDYIHFFSLRKWGKVGPNKKLVTEQLYIHAKTMVVDDRLAIIGSANINERSMRGMRDSECAAIVRDAHQLDSTMAGEPYKVGKFAHTLRVRLMREHLGLDVDQIDYIERQADSLSRARESEQSGENGDQREQGRGGFFQAPTTTVSNMPTESIEMRGFNHFAGIDNIGLREKKTISSDSRIQGNVKHKQDVEGHGIDGWAHACKVREEEQAQQQREKSNLTESQENDLIQEVLQETAVDDLEKFKRTLYEKTAKHSTSGYSTESHSSSQQSSQSSEEAVEDEDDEFDDLDSAQVHVDPFMFKDPCDDSFFFDIWCKIAEKNTSTFRQVFRCQPDDEVTSWKEYKEYVRFGERFSSDQDKAAGRWPGDLEQQKVEQRNTTKAHAPLGAMDDDEHEAQQHEEEMLQQQQEEEQDDDSQTIKNSTAGNTATASTSTNNNGTRGRATSQSTTTTKPHRRRRANTRYSSRRFHHRGEPYDSQEAERILSRGIQGHLVDFPTDWLARELESGNWFYNLDRIPPLEIYD